MNFNNIKSFLEKNDSSVKSKNDNTIEIGNCILVFPLTRANYLYKKYDILELKTLVESSNGYVKTIFTQNIISINSKFFIGKGKIEIIKNYIDNINIKNNINTIVFNTELKGTQIRNLEKYLQLPILDKNMIILNIFSMHAKTYQAKLQVLLAKYQYLLPRLTNMWNHLDNQKGGIGLKGPGEKEIETDKRIINYKINILKNKISEIQKHTINQSHNRKSAVRISLVGYTNAGKSTIMNLLSNANVYVDNKVFSTLDTKIKRIYIKNYKCLLSDTVGFINNIPYNLIKSFKSTLSEVQESDILLHIIDITSEDIIRKIKSVNSILEDLNIDKKKIILVFNKIDQLKNYNKCFLIKSKNLKIYISATENNNINNLKNIIANYINNNLLL
ncbi:MAG: GTPase HflX [Bacteroides sp.]|nr:MAG: GTPase HflX [Bacteroides sp.]